MNRQKLINTKIASYTTWLAVTVVITAICLIMAVASTFYLFFSDFYSVMDGSKVILSRKIIRYGMYIIPYIPFIYFGSNIEFYYKSLKRWINKKKMEEC